MSMRTYLGSVALAVGLGAVALGFFQAALGGKTATVPGIASILVGLAGLGAGMALLRTRAPTPVARLPVLVLALAGGLAFAVASVINTDASYSSRGDVEIRAYGSEVHLWRSSPDVAAAGMYAIGGLLLLSHVAVGAAVGGGLWLGLSRRHGDDEPG